MSNAERFLNAYARIEHELQKSLDLKDYRRFYELLELASKDNPVINRYKFDLRKYSDLRNAIVHDRVDGKIIAEPNDATVKDIERIARLLLKPPRVAPLFQKDVVSIPANAPLARAVKAMSKHNYSQVPVIEGKTISGLLTSNMIVRWMGQKMAEGPLDLQQANVRDVLPFSGAKDNYRIVPPETSLFDVLELFYHFQATAHKLEAVLITRRGQPDDQIMGIITNLDLPRLQHELTQN